MTVTINMGLVRGYKLGQDYIDSKSPVVRGAAFVIWPNAEQRKPCAGKTGYAHEAVI